MVQQTGTSWGQALNPLTADRSAQKDVWTNPSKPLGGAMDALGGAGIANPYVAAAKIAMDMIANTQADKAMMEEAHNKANHMRRQGEAALRRARKQSKDVRDEETFRSVEEADVVRSSGFMTGSESISGGTGVSSVFEANKKAAVGLANDIMEEGRRQKAEYDRAAAETEKAARASKRGLLGMSLDIGKVIHGREGEDVI